MCGICGQLTFNDQPADVDAVARMANTMTARGPDAAGLYCQGRVAFGHRRLSIIDLSSAAQQPMHDPALGMTIVFNGCIYNHPDLRKQLESLGHRFFSDHSDTEVILRSYVQWGEQCVERFNGMFAFAIVERDTGKVFLARDRLGIKPLYYVLNDREFRFASFMPALLVAGDVDTTIDPVALHHYLTFHSVVPPPHTILAGVKKLPPATAMTITADGDAAFHTYWSPQFTRDSEQAKYTQADWEKLLHESLMGAVKRRMIADVPVGVLLSGGLDSSLIVGLLAEQGQTNLNTFSIGFESVGSEKGDEFEYSDIVAKHFGTTHHRLPIDSHESLEQLPYCIAAMSEPMISHDCIGFYLLSREVSKHVKVVQSGQGADEVFAGYHWYPPMLYSNDPLGDYSAEFFDRDHEEMARVLTAAYLGDDYSRPFVESHFAQSGADEPLDKALRIDSTIMLVDDPVKRVDNMTMAWGLEARVPFLDHELVELAAKIPGNLKTREKSQWEKTGGKYILQQVARNVIPHEVIDRPKGYFPVPALKFLRGSFLDMVRDALLSPAAKQRNLFQPAYVQMLLDNPETHLTPLKTNKLWQLALLELWLQKHGIS